MSCLQLNVRHLLVIALCSLSIACASNEPSGPPVSVGYVGSSTVAVFLRDAELVYRGLEFQLDTAPESSGGERAIVEGKTQLAGIAAEPQASTLAAGVRATLVGRDAIAVVLNTANPVSGLSLEQLRSVFTGQVKNWSAVGGPDLLITPLIVGKESATNRVFQSLVLQGEAYAETCREIRPDRKIINEVASTPGAIGQISFSFLRDGAAKVRAIAVDGEGPSVTNLNYPIARPLNLLTRGAGPALNRFLDWTQTEEGQRVVMRHFVGTRVVGTVTPQRAGNRTGWLIVHTKTMSVRDGGIYYYPHRSYTVLDRHGNFVREVRNHRGDNDEHPMHVELPVGTYLIRADAPETGPVEFFVTVELGETRSVDVGEFLAGGR